MLDKISEKIDYMFRRSKNADERCFDFFLRSITFFIILLVVLLYGSFVHADSNSASQTEITLGTGSVFVGSELDIWLQDQGYQRSDFSTVGICSGLNSYLFNTSDLPNLKIPDSVTYNDVTYYPEDYNIILGGATVHDYGQDWLSVYIIVGDDVILGNGGTICYSFTNNFGIFRGSVSQNNLSTMYPDNPHYIYLGQGNHTNSSYNTDYYYYYFSSFQSPLAWTNAPCYTVLVNNDTNSVYNDFAMVYDRFPEQIFQINYQYAAANPDPDPEQDLESNSNHLYLKDFQIGLSAFNSVTDVKNSSVVIGIDVDDWILNHIDDYQLHVVYTINYSDSNSSIGDINGVVDSYVPLRTFLYDTYVYSVDDIMEQIPVNGALYSNFDQYYSLLNSNFKQSVVSNIQANTHGIFPTFDKGLDCLISCYSLLNQSSSYQGNTNTITKFDLQVSIMLFEIGTDNHSDFGMKVFDFVNGSESIKRANILQNYDPWEGEQDPQQSPLVPSSNYPVGGYGGGSNGNTNISVNVSGQKVPIGVKTRAEIETILNNYKAVNDNFMDQWQDLSDPNNNNNFIKFLNQETRQLPAVDYLISGACCIFGLSIILFVLKVLLF